MKFNYEIRGYYKMWKYIYIIFILSYFLCVLWVLFPLKGALFLLKGILASPNCTVSVLQNKSVNYIISEPTGPGCIPEWTSAVSTSSFFVLVCFQTFVSSGKINYISNIFIHCLVSRTPCLLMRRGTFTIQLFCMLIHKGFSPLTVSTMSHIIRNVWYFR